MKKLILTVATLVTMSISSFAQLGSADKDLVYTPVTPCRVLDTRTTQGGTGAIAANGTKHFKIWGQTSFVAQGGSATNCSLTAGSDVAAVAMNFTVVTPTAGGFITAYPFGVARPTAATVNFQVGDIARGDFTIAKVTQTGTDHLSIFSASLADVVGDVVGYYSPPLITQIQCVETNSPNMTISAGSWGSAVTPACAAGYTLLSGGCTMASSDGRIVSSRLFHDTQTQFCSFRNEGAVGIVGVAYGNCCRIPGR
jgi:hypothetical protein